MGLPIPLCANSLLTAEDLPHKCYLHSQGPRACRLHYIDIFWQYRRGGVYTRLPPFYMVVETLQGVWDEANKLPVEIYV